MVVPKNGTAIPYQEKYQLAPAVTKNAPDKNLQTSFQLIFLITSEFVFFYFPVKRSWAMPAI